MCFSMRLDRVNVSLGDTAKIAKPIDLLDSASLNIPRCCARLALFDIDGTLRNRQGVVSDGVRRALAALRDSGCAIGFASGRPLFSAFPMISDLEMNAPSILMAGGLVVRPSGEVRWSRGMTSSEAVSLVDASRKLDLDVELITAVDYFTERQSELLAIHASYHPKRSEHVEDLMDIARTGQVIKASLIVDPATGADKLEMIREQLPNLRFSVAHGAAHPELYFVNATSAKTSPIEALRVVLMDLQLKPEEVVCFGDGESDIPLMSSVGFSVAMGNAKAVVKQAALFTTGTVEEDGVASAIRLLFGVS